VERLAVAEGATVELDRVLVIGDGDKLTLGRPIIEGARVMATSKGDGKGDKVIGMKYKAKVRYSRKIGHRQPYTELAIDSISGPGIKAEKPVKAAKVEKPEEAAEVAEKPAARPRRRAEKAEEAATVVEKPAAKPRRRTVKKEVKENGS